MTCKCVLDSSIIIKAFVKPNPSLASDVYNRELSTHNKCVQILQYIQESGIDIIIPKICVIEVAAVINRLADQKRSHIIASRIYSTCTIVHEEDIFNEAWKIAEIQGCSGFDTYFLAVAFSYNILLITDDSGMHNHARKKSIQSFLVRECELSSIIQYFSK